MRCLVVLVALTACKASLGDGMHDGGPVGPVGDGPADASAFGPWGAPTPIGIPPVGDDDPTATDDLLEL